MAGNAGAALELNNVEALHDFVVMQLAKLLTGNFEVGWNTPSADDFVFVLRVGDGHVGRDDVADLVKFLCQIFLELVSCGLKLLNLDIEGLRLGNLFFTLVLTL